MKILVSREKTFSESVPPIPQFIDLVRAKRMHVRKRNQLHSGRSVGIEPRQLATGGSQRQRERLHAIAEKITAGQQVVGIEAVVYLGNHAGQPIERRRNNRSSSG